MTLNQLYSASISSGLKMLGLLALFLPAWGMAQSNHFAYRQFTANDGLPSSEVYDILQDKLGYIWFSTDNGVSRFDGYSFQNYGVVQGLKEPVVFYMQEDREKGRIWMQSLAGRLYYFEKDSIYPFSGNRVLDSLGLEQFCEIPFYLDSLGSIYVSLSAHGLLQFDTTGKVDFLLSGHYSKSVYEIENRAILVFSDSVSRPVSVRNPEEVWNEKGQFPLDLYLNSGHYKMILPRKGYPAQSSAFRVDDKTVLLRIYEKLWAFQEGKLIWSIPYPDPINFWFKDQDGSIFLGLSARLGLRRYKSLEAIRTGIFESYLQGYSVSHFIVDQDGGYWFSTTEAGVFYLADPALKIYDQSIGLPVDYVSSIALKNQDACYIGLEGGGVVLLNTETEKISPLPNVGGWAYDLVYNQEADVLWAAINFKIYSFRENQWQICRDKLYPNNATRLGYQARRLHLSPQKSTLWATSSFGFNEINFEKGEVVFSSLHDLRNGTKAYNFRTLDAITTRNGQVFIANTNGLFELINQELVALNIDHPAFHARIEAIEELPDSTLVLGSKGYGLLFWKGDQIAVLTESDGLSANMIENLYAAGDGVLWVGTLNGLNKVNWSWDRAASIRVFSTANGFPTNEINCVKTRGDVVWVATTKGLVKFSWSQPRLHSPAPIIKVALASGGVFDPGRKAYVDYKENNLIIHFLSLNYKMNGQIPYRYRLNSDDWVFTKSTTVHFPSMQVGQQEFEVQAQNEDGIWSTSSFFVFQIMPPWWKSWWFKFLAFFTCISIGILIYQYRMRQLKHENDMQRQMVELERSALQAQMNPHFIFNCLNSIQNYILQNEKKEAILYLGRFATLVRSILNASASGNISLHEELKLLTNYLDLEKLRFKDRFIYTVELAPGLDTFDLRIPPLLVQPYVENAVLHGISGKKEGGIVRVCFEAKPGFLEVTIEDNGPGIQIENTTIPKNYKSFGISITRDRLKLLSGNPEGEAVHTENVLDENALICGTRVKVRIGLQKDNSHSEI
ncbi:MAG: histidine kinase [Saprospiraceae bacterium]|nr:histidine kinase [Saprospiraceae bacterium]